MSRVLLGIDYGTVRVGLALAVDGLIVPLTAMPHPGSEEALAEQLAAVIAERSAEAAVIGLPLHMDGSQSPMADKASAVAKLLEEQTAAEVHLVDERLTSHGAEASLREAGLRWFEVDKGHIDCVSAMAILRDFIGVEAPARDPDEDLLPEPPPPPPSRAQRRRDLRRKRRK